MKLEKEEWRDIKGFERLYQVSSLGRVMNHKGRIIKPYVDRRKEWYSYCRVGLWKDGKCRKHAVHRLVAEAFLPNPNNYPMINHKDENPSNNRVNNLEWCDCSYNLNYGTAMKEEVRLE